uniref:AlNc14C82G5322 protein n=1 Tax=Albugo laibachii Nc14 TaxID=890382 RepID=F0WFD2_9STRA|nr:AlNc14C82G5322 [Albugo laibachii Nc14]|eukprot:CCA19914.1 AlNc14C82G5322 [Albugo laibachii Nc14]
MCMNLLKKLPFEEPKEKNPSTEYYAHSRSVKHGYPFVSERDSYGMKVTKFIENAATSWVYCLRLDMSTNTEATAPSGSCLPRHYGEASIAVNKDQTRIVYLFSRILEKRKEDLCFCKNDCGRIEALGSKDSRCQLRVVDHFTNFPTGDHFLTEISRGMRREMYADYSMKTGCVWAQYTFQESHCLRCLERMRDSTLHRLSDSTALVSLHPFANADTDGRKRHLAGCVDGSECSQIMFLPNIICAYELDLESFARIQFRAESNPQLATNPDPILDIFTQSTSVLHAKAKIQKLSSFIARPRKALLENQRNPHTLIRRQQLTVPEMIRPLSRLASATSDNPPVQSEGHSMSNGKHWLCLSHTPASGMDTRTKRQKISSDVSDWLTMGPSISAARKPLPQSENDATPDVTTSLALGSGPATRQIKFGLVLVLVLVLPQSTW